MIGQVASIAEDRLSELIVFNKPVKHKLNQPVSVEEKKAHRSLAQNGMYFAYLTWCIHPSGGNLYAEGWLSVDAMHENIKCWIKENHKRTFKEDFSTAELNKPEFAEFFNLVDYEYMTSGMHIDTSPFHARYQQFIEWRCYNPNGTFKEFMGGL